MVGPSGCGGGGDGCRLDVGGSVGGCAALGMVHPAASVIEVLRFGGRGKAALAFSPSPGLRKGTGGLFAASAAPVGLQAVGKPPSVLWPSEPASWPRTCKRPFIRKQKRAVCSPATPATSGLAAASSPRSPCGLRPRSDQGGRGGSSMWALCLRDPRGRDQHHSTGFPTATEARKIRSRGSRMERNSSGRTGLRSTCRRLGYSQRGSGPLGLSSVGAHPARFAWESGTIPRASSPCPGW